MQSPNVARLRLWNPLTGHVVPVRDPSCELREVRSLLECLIWTAAGVVAVWQPSAVASLAVRGHGGA
jgi:hypothetical protein